VDAAVYDHDRGSRDDRQWSVEELIDAAGTAEYSRAAV
jgi:hypothetical protein